MPEVEDFLPIFPEETEATVMARLLAWLNEGVDPSEPTWIDPREGGIARTLLTPAAREIALVYDRVSVEFPAAATPLFAWGIYLDQWALALGTERLAATPADGFVTITATNGTVVPEDTEVSVGLDVSTEPPSFLTQAAVTVGPSGSVTVQVTATEAGTVGNVPAHAVTVLLSSLTDPNAAVDNASATTGGTDEETDEALRERLLAIYSTTTGGGNVADYVQWVRALPGVGAVTITPEAYGPGTVGVLATTPTGDPVSDAVRLTVRNYLDPPAVDQAISAVTANTITVGSTAGYRTSGIVHIGPVNLSNERIHNYTGLTATQFTGVTPAPTLNAGDHVWQTGRGGGRAPIGHHIVVGRATVLNVTIAATLELAPGYTLDATPATVAVRQAVEGVLRAYLNDELAAGAEIVLQRIEAVILGVEGVYDIGSVQINGVAANVRPAVTEVPTFAAATLTAGTIT